MNLKIRDRRYVSHGDPKPDEGSRSAGTSAVHVSLSSDEIVKQQDRPIYSPNAKAPRHISPSITPWLTEPVEPLRFKWRRVSARRKVRGDAVDGRCIGPQHPNRQDAFCEKRPSSDAGPVDMFEKRIIFRWLCNEKFSAFRHEVTRLSRLPALRTGKPAWSAVLFPKRASPAFTRRPA